MGNGLSRMRHQVSHLHFSSVECMHMNHEVNHHADPSIEQRAPCSLCHGLHYAAGVHFGPLSDRFRR